MSDWSSDSEELFRATRREISPSADDRARVRARLAIQLAAAAVVAAPGNASAATASTAAKSVPLLVKLLAPLLFVGGVGVYLVAARSPAPTVPAPATDVSPPVKAASDPAPVGEASAPGVPVDQLPPLRRARP